MFFGCRNNFIALLKLARKKKYQKSESLRTDSASQIGSSESLDDPSEQRRVRIKFIVLAVFIFLAIVGISVGVDDI